MLAWRSAVLVRNARPFSRESHALVLRGDAREHLQDKLGGTTSERPSERLVSLGFQRSETLDLEPPSSAQHPSSRKKTSTQRERPDDVTVKTSREEAEWLVRKFNKRFEIKTQIIGEAASCRSSTRWLRVEAEPRRVKEVVRALGLEGGSPASILEIATKGEIKVEDAKRTAPIPSREKEETTMCRAVAARLNNLSQDRPNGRSRRATQDLKNMRRVGRSGALGGNECRALCMPWLTQTGREMESRGCRSAQARFFIEKHKAGRPRHQHRPCRTARWQPCSTRGRRQFRRSLKTWAEPCRLACTSTQARACLS